MIMKKLLIFLTALMLLLCACSVPAGSSKIDYGSFEGYYSTLAYEVHNEAGETTEQMFVLFTDESMQTSVGTKDVFFDTDSGNMTKYTVTIGIEDIEQLVTYTSGDGSSYYSEMHFSDGKLARTTWDNSYSGENGSKIRSTGSEEYYTDGVTMKSHREELYRDGTLEQTTTREYSEDGTVTSETIE